MSTITAGVDLAKSSFPVCEMGDLDACGIVTISGATRLPTELPAGTVEAMEACSGRPR